MQRYEGYVNTGKATSASRAGAPTKSLGTLPAKVGVGARK